ncbi:MAG: hypothetical protein PUG09_04065 [Prevotella sp.]|nr:hypothetical protein [Prevotella sp.]
MKHRLWGIIMWLTLLPSFATAQSLSGKTFWTLFDSLGDTSPWQPLLGKLTGMTFIDSLNYHIMSYGGTTSEPFMLNGTLGRAKLLVAQKGRLPIDLVLLENTNDINLFAPDGTTEGSLKDQPWMQGTKRALQQGPFSSLEAARQYADKNFAHVVASVPESKRKAGAMITLPYTTAADTGTCLSITRTPQRAGTIYIINKSAKVAIHVTPAMTTGDIIREMAQHAYGAGWTAIDNGDSTLTIHYCYHFGRKVRVNTMNTGMEVRLRQAPQSLEYTLYFTGNDSKEWFDPMKWTDHVSLYSAYRGLFAYLKKNLPTTKFYWVIPYYFNYDYNDPALLNSDGSINAAALKRTRRGKQWQALIKFQRRMCKEAGIPVIDITKTCGITLKNVRFFYKPSNPHPNQAAYDLWAKALAAKLKASVR